jgi:hypothetical protein
MGVNPILSQSREWLIQPEALRSMAIAARSFDSGTINLAANKPSSPLLTIDKGIGVIAIEGPLVRKPDIFARVLMGATDALEIGDAIREASERDDIKAGMPELAFSAIAGAGGDERKFPAPVAVSGGDRAGRAIGRAALQAGPRAAGRLKFSEIRFRAQRARVGRHMQATPPRVDTWAKLCFISPAPRFNTHRISIHHVH